MRNGSCRRRVRCAPQTPARWIVWLRGKRGAVRMGPGQTYLQLENRSNHVKAGRNGRRNWRVMGNSRPSMSRAAVNVFAKGPGSSLTDKEKMAIMAKIKYWPSYMDHGCERSERSVSAGEKEVSSEAMDDVGDCLLCMRDFVALHLRRTRWGMKLGRADNPGMWALESISVAELSRNAK
jgi:hypothetical protein